MPRISFTSNLKRHLACPTAEVTGATVADALAQVFADNPRLRSYLLDDQGHLRKHVVIYVNQQPVRDRVDDGERQNDRRENDHGPDVPRLPAEEEREEGDDEEDARPRNDKQQDVSLEGLHRREQQNGKGRKDDRVFAPLPIRTRTA